MDEIFRAMRVGFENTKRPTPEQVAEQRENTVAVEVVAPPFRGSLAEFDAMMGALDGHLNHGVRSLPTGEWAKQIAENMKGADDGQG